MTTTSNDASITQYSSIHRLCAECGNALTFRDKQARLNKTFCSKACSVKNSIRAIHSKIYQKKCKECNISFISRNGSASYCSDLCKRKPNKRRSQAIILIKNCMDCSDEIKFSRGRIHSARAKTLNIRCNKCAKNKWQRDKCGDPNISWYERNQEKIRKYYSTKSELLKLEMIAAYGGKCNHCSIKNPIVLALDHINNDGSSDRLKCGRRMGGVRFYAFLKRIGWPKDKLQLLCYNCNFQKEYIRRKKEAGNPTKLLNVEFL